MNCGLLCRNVLCNRLRLDCGLLCGDCIHCRCFLSCGLICGDLLGCRSLFDCGLCGEIACVNCGLLCRNILCNRLRLDCRLLGCKPCRRRLDDCFYSESFPDDRLLIFDDRHDFGLMGLRIRVGLLGVLEPAHEVVGRLGFGLGLGLLLLDRLGLFLRLGLRLGLLLLDRLGFGLGLDDRHHLGLGLLLGPLGFLCGLGVLGHRLVDLLL